MQSSLYTEHSLLLGIESIPTVSYGNIACIHQQPEPAPPPRVRIESKYLVDLKTVSYILFIQYFGSVLRVCLQTVLLTECGIVDSHVFKRLQVKWGSPFTSIIFQWFECNFLPDSPSESLGIKWRCWYYKHSLLQQRNRPATAEHGCVLYGWLILYTLCVCVCVRVCACVCVCVQVRVC